MGIKKIGKNIWKLIWSAIFAVIFIIGLCMCLSAYGVGLDTNAFGNADHLDSQKFWSYVMMGFGLVFGIIPFFKIFKTLLKFAFSIFGIVIFAYGLCATLNAYDVVSINWATSVVNGKTLGPVLIIIGTIGGVIPFIKCWKKIFCDDKSDKQD